jgi:hypothetical protein
MTMKMKHQPAVKDEDAGHPVASAWRSTFHEIVKAFARGDFQLSGGVARVAPISASRAKQIKNYLEEYGETLCELGEETWNTSVAQWMRDDWEVLVDLWTKESGASDLVLHARVTEVDDGYRVVVDSVHVP